MQRLYGVICPYCGRETRLGEHVVVCEDCGVPHHEVCWVKHAGCMTSGCHGKPTRPVNTPSASRSLDKMFGIAYAGDAAGKTCPYCQSTIDEGAHAMICGRCSTPHHLVCWQHNGGCTTYGCVAPILRKSDPYSDTVRGPIDMTGLTVKPGTDDLDLEALSGGLVGAVGGLGIGLFVGGPIITVVLIAVCSAAGAAVGSLIASRRRTD